jgi:hypothetical protein
VNELQAMKELRFKERGMNECVSERGNELCFVNALQREGTSFYLSEPSVLTRRKSSRYCE